LGWFFRNPIVWPDVARLTTGMGNRRQRVKPEALLTYELPVPPLPEQARIVTRIDRLAARIGEARQLYAERRLALPAILKSARRELIGDEPKPDWIPLRQAILDIENGWSPQCLSQPATKGKWGVLKVGAVSFGSFDPRQNKELPESLQPLPQYEIKSGDFLMSRANTVELVGACALVESTPPRLILCDKIFRFRFGQNNHVEPAFLNHVLKSPALRTQIEAGATGTSPTMRNISKGKIMNLRIPVPAIQEQRRIISILNDLQTRYEELQRSHATTSLELTAMLPSILDRAFKGEL
jgi:type I restriction enzyme S subunit